MDMSPSRLLIEQGEKTSPGKQRVTFFFIRNILHHHAKFCFAMMRYRYRHFFAILI